MTEHPPRPRIAMIVAMTDDHVIGRDNKMPWHLPADLAHFRRLTTGKPIIMGRKTYESIGRPLPQRHNIVVTRNRDFQAEGITVVPDLTAALDKAGDVPEIMIIGGAEIYTTLLPQADRLYVTYIHADIAGDTRFPQIDAQEWREQSREDHPPDA